MACEHCDDTGWKAITADGVRRVVRCDCWHEQVIARTLKNSGLPPRYARCDLENFRDYNDSLVKAVHKAKALAESFPVVDKGLLLLGTPGIGKTHLAVGILKRAVQRTGARALFYDTRTLLAHIRNTYSPVVKTTEASAIQPVLDAQFLVLDDLGAERPTEWVEETMNLIINTRYNMKRLTVFTSNYPDKQKTGSHAETLEERVGSRIFSRLFEMCEFVQMRGVHYRELDKDAGPEDISGLDKSGSQLQKEVGEKRKPPMLRASLKPAKELGWSGGKSENRK
jgi:DNA replication protein DnaC